MDRRDETWQHLGAKVDPMALLRGLFEHSPVPYAIFRADGHCVLTNPAHTAMFGRPPPPEYNVLADEVMERLGVSTLIQRAFQGETVSTPTIWYDPKELKHVDGADTQRAAISLTFFPLRDEQGAVAHVAIAYKDVTAELAAGEAAEAERDLLHAVMEQSADGIIVADAAGDIRLFNSAAERQHGVTSRPSQAPEWPASDRLFGLDGRPLSHEQTALSRAVRGETVRNARWLVRRPDGQIRLLEGTASPVRRPDGTSAGAVLITRDETERTRAEEAQRQSEERYRCLVEATTSVIWTRSATGVFAGEQPGWSRFTGQSNEELRGWGWLEAVHPDDRERVRATWLGTIGRGRPDHQIEYRLRRHDGAWRWVEGRAVPVREPDGRVREWVGLNTDVTDKHAAEASLRFLADASEALAASLDYEATLAAAGRVAVPFLADWCFVDLAQDDGTFRRVEVVHADADGAPLARMIRNLVIDPRATPGYPASDAFARGSTVMIADAAEARLLTLPLTDTHLGNVRSVRPRSLMAIPLTARGRTFGVLTLLTSRSERRYGDAERATAEDLARRAALAADNARLYREAQGAIALRDEFLSIASHELKTPLTPLQLQLQAIERRVPEITRDDEARRWLEKRVETLRRSGARLNRLVDGLLDVSRIAGGRLKLTLEPVDLAGVVRDVVGGFEGQGLIAAGCELRVDAPSAVIGRWDRLRLEQIVTNLISNASKYGAGQPVDINVGKDGEVATLVVADRGIGIAPESQDRIFGRFERAASARHYGGLGLGLYIARQLVEAMGGEIGVSSQPGEGSIFTVKLALSGPSSQPPAA